MANRRAGRGRRPEFEDEPWDRLHTVELWDGPR